MNILVLPNELFLEIQKNLNESDIRSIGSVSRTMHSIFQPTNQLPNKFLQRVAYGEQDKAEALFTDVYQGDVEMIQQALRYQGRFTDYSGRTFNCTAYEYAYWAKDTHMCRMLEKHMDEETKAFMAARIDAIERIDAATGKPVGLVYRQEGQQHRSAHFDFTPIKEAYQRYIENCDGWDESGGNEGGYEGDHAREVAWGIMEEAWIDWVGQAQRNVPAHVAQEFCRPNLLLDPTDKSEEKTLLRGLEYYNINYDCFEDWFPLTASGSGLGFDLALVYTEGACVNQICVDKGEAKLDLAAIIHLDEVRTEELTLSRQNLNPAAGAHGMAI